MCLRAVARGAMLLSIPHTVPSTVLTNGIPKSGGRWQHLSPAWPNRARVCPFPSGARAPGPHGCCWSRQGPSMPSGQAWGRPICRHLCQSGAQKPSLWWGPQLPISLAAPSCPHCGQKAKVQIETGAAGSSEHGRGGSSARSSEAGSGMLAKAPVQPRLGDFAFLVPSQWLRS